MIEKMPKPKQQKVTASYATRKSNRKVKFVDLVEEEEKVERKCRKHERKTVAKNSKEKYDKDIDNVPEERDIEHEEREILINFDLDHLLGPCRGITRMERLERARRFGIESKRLDHVQKILDDNSDEPMYSKCIWDQRFQY